MPAEWVGDLLRQEFDQAWEHYRHMESQRNQYLGFLFAAIAGFVPLTAATETLQITEASRDLVIQVEILVYVVLAAFVLLTLRRSTAVRSHYMNVLYEIRRRMYGNQFDEFMNFLDAYRSPVVIADRFRIAAMGEWLTAFTLVAFSAGLATTEWVVFSRSRSWQTWSGLLPAALSIGCAIWVLWTASRKPAQTVTSTSDRSVSDDLDQRATNG